MRNILVINSSASSENSVSRTLVDYAVERLLEDNPGAVVTRRDLDSDPLPHLTSRTVAGIRAVAATDAEQTAQALSDTLISELKTAEMLVIGAPMYNFSVPTSLRAWFDHVLRPRVTFAYGAAGPQGLLSGLRAIVIQSRGGFYSEGPGREADFQEPYLRQLLGFIGVTDVSFVHAEKIGFGREARSEALASARARIDAVVAAGSPEAETVPPAPDGGADQEDYRGIMEANLHRVFNEPDADRRAAAIREIYAGDAVLHEPDNSVRGHDAIALAVTHLLGSLPPNFVFSEIRPALGHNGVGRLPWRSGPSDGPAAVTGLDVAHIRDGLIHSLHVFLDPPDASAN